MSTGHFKSGTTAEGVYFEVHGHGRPLFLGFPIMASHAAIFGAAQASTREAFLDGLTDRYRVLLVDYPNIGKSAAPAPEEMTVTRVCADMLVVADAAGFEQFIWWGGTFGAVVGLHLAANGNRVAALVSAGWPPLGAPYAEMLRGGRANLANPPEHARVILREPAQYAQWVTFYESVAGWPEADDVSRIRCPRLLAYGANAYSSVGDIPLPLAPIIRERCTELESLGWDVIEIADADAGVILDAARLLPVVRRWLDALP